MPVDSRENGLWYRMLLGGLRGHFPVDSRKSGLWYRWEVQWVGFSLPVDSRKSGLLYRKDLQYHYDILPVDSRKNGLLYRSNVGIYAEALWTPAKEGSCTGMVELVAVSLPCGLPQKRALVQVLLLLYTLLQPVDSRKRGLLYRVIYVSTYFTCT